MKADLLLVFCFKGRWLKWHHHSLESLFWVLFLPRLHKGDQFLYTFKRHGSVKTRSASFHRIVASQVMQVVLSGIFSKLLLHQWIVANSERNGNSWSVLDFDLVDVKPIWSVNVVVKECSFLNNLVPNDSDSALVEHMLAGQATHVHWPSWGCVVHHIFACGVQFPVRKLRSVRSMSWHQIISDDGDSQSSRAQVLGSTSKDHSILWPVNWLGTNVWSHVWDKNHVLWQHIKRELIEFYSLDGFIVAVVKELSWRVNDPLWRVFYCEITSIASLVDTIGCVHILSCLEYGLFDPSASDQVVCGVFVALSKVVADWVELVAPSSLQKKDSEVVRNFKIRLQTSSSVLVNLDVLFLSMRHLHHAVAKALPIQNLALSFFEHWLVKFTGAWAEIVDTTLFFAHYLSLFL